VLVVVTLVRQSYLNFFFTRLFIRCAVFKVQMVGLGGLEPPTSRLSGVRSDHLSYKPNPGGDERNRTADPLLARQVLSQLSYTPILKQNSAKEGLA
jgi:hypothetical protein